MNSDVLLRVVPRVALVVLAVAALGLHRATVEYDGNVDQRRAAVERLRDDAGRVDALALSVRLASLPSYDPLVDAVATLRRDVKELDVDGAEARAARETLRALVDARTLEIEELKARRSTLENSERALAQLIAEPRVAVDADLCAALMAFLLSRTARTEDALDAVRARLVLSLDPSAALMARHAGIVLEGRRLIEDSAARFLHEPLAGSAMKLAVVVDHDGRATPLRGLTALVLGLLLMVSVAGLWPR